MKTLSIRETLCNIASEYDCPQLPILEIGEETTVGEICGYDTADFPIEGKKENYSWTLDVIEGKFVHYEFEKEDKSEFVYDKNLEKLFKTPVVITDVWVDL